MVTAVASLALLFKRAGRLKAIPIPRTRAVPSLLYTRVRRPPAALKDRASRGRERFYHPPGVLARCFG
jgi:hypothetical protein